MPTIFHMKSHPSPLLCVPLLFASSYAPANPKEKQKPLLPFHVGDQTQNLQVKPQKELPPQPYGRNIALGTLWTLSWAAATATSTYYSITSEAHYLYKEAIISGALTLGGVWATVYNTCTYCKSRRRNNGL